jgi:hypothetical protein
MSIMELGALGELFGAIAVVVTLIYLSIQLRHNTDATRLSSVQMSVESSAEFNSMLATSAELNDIFWKGMADPDCLDPQELRRFASMLNMYLRREALAYHLYKIGHMPHEFWGPRERTLHGILNQPGTRWWVENLGEVLPANFREYLQGVLASESTLTQTMREIMTPAGATRSDT